MKKQKGSKVDVVATLNEPVEVVRAGTRQKVPAFEVAVRQLVKRGLAEKNLNAILEFLDLCQEYGVMKLPLVDLDGSVIVAPKGVDFHEWVDSVTEMVPASTPNDEDDYD